MNTQHLLILSFITICFAANAQSIELVPYASGFDEPVDIANAADNRLFVAEKDGAIKIVVNGVVLSPPFMDIDNRINSGGNERGLLGLAFHPDYENNGYFYVNYTALDGSTRISRFSVGNEPDIADPDSELILMTIAQPGGNHNGGDLNFGPDGYLYCGLGDGGGSGDQYNNGQNRQSLLGKIIRIDVDNPLPNLNYGIPADNPFVNDASTLDEIWALGLRNPWRFSFDRETGDMWIADVGQDDWEEIDFQSATSSGGENYGWRCYEGDVPFNTGGCADADTFTLPAHTYPNSSSTGCSVTGGFVYRGTTQATLEGKYIYADFCSGRFWSISPDGAGAWVNEDLGNFANEEFSTFGEDNNGELYVAAVDQGQIYRISDACTDFEAIVNKMDICEGSDDLGTASIQLNNAVFPINIIWSNGATSGEITDLAEGMYSVTVEDANACSTIIDFEINTIPAIDAPFVTSSHNNPNEACEGDTITLTASEAPEGYGYQWYRGICPDYCQVIEDATAQTLEITEVVLDDFCVQYTGACPSDFSNKITISIQEVPTPVVAQTPEGNLTLENIQNFDDAFTWFLDGDIISVQSCDGIGYDQWCIQPTQEGLYTLCVFYNLLACSACSEPFNYTAVSTENITGIDEFQISPRPVNDILYINLNTTKKIDLQIKLQNTYGQTLIEKQESISGNWNSSLNISHLPSGTYFLTLESGNQIMTRKISVL